MKKHTPKLFLILVLLYFLFILKPALTGELSGTFQTTSTPQEYKRLEKFLASDNKFGRTLWIPAVQRFAYYSNMHPSVSAFELFDVNEVDSVIKEISTPETEKLLQELSIKYVIVPYDSQEELFLTDRVYDEKEYIETIDALRDVEYLSEVEGFEKVKIFQVQDPKPHFWSKNPNMIIEAVQSSPVSYEIKIQNAKKEDAIVFTDNYDKNWKAKVNNTKATTYKSSVNSLRVEGYTLNSFKPGISGDYTLKVSYEPQKWANIGFGISVATLAIILGTLLFIWLGNKKVT